MAASLSAAVTRAWGWSRLVGPGVPIRVICTIASAWLLGVGAWLGDVARAARAAGV